MSLWLAAAIYLWVGILLAAAFLYLYRKDTKTEGLIDLYEDDAVGAMLFGAGAIILWPLVFILILAVIPLRIAQWLNRKQRTAELLEKQGQQELARSGVGSGVGQQTLFRFTVNPGQMYHHSDTNSTYVMDWYNNDTTSHTYSIVTK